MSENQKTKFGAHLDVAKKMIFVVVFMFGFGYALVPIYDILCEVTGLNGKTGVIEQAQGEAAEPDFTREITVQFTGGMGAGAPFTFKPEKNRMVVHPGKLYNTAYIATNLAPVPVAAQAAPSVAPREASLYFNKTECFCFTKQEFEGSEKKLMPVQFIIDRDIPKHIKTVTLSYTFFELAAPSAGLTGRDDV